MTHRQYRGVRFAAALLACTALAAVPTALAAQEADLSAHMPSTVHYGTWGVDISTRDLSVKPGDDFQRYAAGHWLDTEKLDEAVRADIAYKNAERLLGL